MTTPKTKTARVVRALTTSTPVTLSVGAVLIMISSAYSYGQGSANSEAEIKALAKRVEVLETQFTASLSDIKSEVREIRTDVKDLLRRSK